MGTHSIADAGSNTSPRWHSATDNDRTAKPVKTLDKFVEEPPENPNNTTTGHRFYRLLREKQNETGTNSYTLVLTDIGITTVTDIASN